MKLISICATWVSGIFLGSIFNLPVSLILCGLLPVPFIFIFKKYRGLLVIISIFLTTLFGAAYYYSASSVSDTDFLSLINTGTIELKGTIKTAPDARDKVTHIKINLEESKITGEWRKSRGLILLYVPRYPQYEYGDTLWLKGKLESPVKLDAFDYQAYLARQGIQATMTFPEIKLVKSRNGNLPLSWIYSVREALSQSLTRALPEPQASLGQGIVLGIQSTIPDYLKTDLSITGTAHLLAISGINLSIIAGILVSMGIWLWGRRYSIYIWLSLFMIWLYSLLTGMQAPVIRAAIMATVFLLAELLGRQKNAFAALAFSAAIMVGIDPQVLWSVSFQLSFLAMMGLILIAPPMQSWVRKKLSTILHEGAIAFRLAMLVTDSFCISLAALIAVWPLIAFYFHIFSLIGPVSTLLIAPSLPAIMVSGAITAIVGLFSEPAAQVIGWSSWLFLSYMLGLVYVSASLPLTYLNTGQISKEFFWSYYVLLTLLVCWKAHIQKLAHQFILQAKALKTHINKTAGSFSAIPKKWIIIPLIGLAFMTSFTAATMPDSDLHVSILDVKQGDAILIQNGRQNILIDGGPSPQNVCQGLSDKMPFWDKTIDLVILTHPHLDHINGLVEVLQRYRVIQVLAPGLTSEIPVFKEWQDLIITHNIRYTTAITGQQINLKADATLEVLSPLETTVSQLEKDFDDSGVALKLTKKRISFLFMADTGKKTEDTLINRRSDLKSTVLKVAHHGSSTSTSVNFLAAVNPQIACISVGEDNLYNLPNNDVLSRLKNAMGPAKQIYRTDKNGTLEFITDGLEIRVKTDK